MKLYSDAQRRAQRRGYYSRVYCQETRCRSWVFLGETRKLARIRLETLRGEEALGPQRKQSSENARLTFADAVSRWLSVKKETVSVARYEILRSRSSGYWIPFFRNTLLSDVTTEKLRQYASRRRSGKLRGPGGIKRKLSAVTINDDVAQLRQFLSFCTRAEWLSRNPAVGVEKFSGEIRRRVRTLTEDEERQLLAACEGSATLTISAKRNHGGRGPGKLSKLESTFRQKFPAPPYLRPLVQVALDAGFRRRTLLSLRWKDIDLARGRWNIPGESMKTSEDYSAPATAAVVAELKRFREKLLAKCVRDKTPPAARLGPQALIFGLAPAARISHAFSTAVKRAGIRRVTLHDLRRNYVNKLRRVGVGIDAAMRLSGHKSLATMLKFYREVPEQDLEAAVRALDGSAASAERKEAGDA